MMISGGAIVTIEAALIDLAEYVTENITLQNVATQQLTLQAVRQTLLNALSILDSYSIQVVMASEYTTLLNINSASLPISNQDIFYVTNRLTSFQSLVNTVYPLPVWVNFDINNLTMGEPALPLYDLISYFCTFNYEPVPVALNNTNLEIIANQAADAWLDILNYIQFNGTAVQQTAYDAVNRMYQSSQDTADLIGNLSLSPVFNSTSVQINLFTSANYALLGGQLPTNIPNGSLQFVGGAYGGVDWTSESFTGNEALEFQITSGGVIGANTGLPGLAYKIQGTEVFTLWVNIQDLTPDEILFQVYSGGMWRSVYWGTTEYFSQFTGITPINVGTVPTQIGQWVGLTFTLQSLGLPTNAVITGIGWGVYNHNNTTTMIFSNFTTAINVVNSGFQQVWNSLVALPSLLRVASLLNNDPSSLIWQQVNAIRFLIYLLILQTNTLLTSFGAPNNSATPTLVQLRVGETLLDFAARTTGDVTQWTTIAAINGLVPPYTSTTPAPGVATPGTKLYIPPGPSSTAQISDYSTTFLGTDVNLGPIGQPLVTWTGDFATISGLNNYIYALYRRVLTPLGNLIYHTTYGDQLPSQIGNIQTASQAGLLAGYLKSALQSDPRTYTVNNVTAVPIDQDQVALISTVTPYGGAPPTGFNLILVRQSPAINASQVKLVTS